jgi:hypothetical protein
MLGQYQPLRTHQGGKGSGKPQQPAKNQISKKIPGGHEDNWFWGSIRFQHFDFAYYFPVDSNFRVEEVFT